MARHDEALDLLLGASLRLDAGSLTGSRRAQANLRLLRSWLEMSAFHLEALRLHTQTPAFTGSRSVTYVDAVKLSDCLPAYDGREISEPEERALAVPPELADGQHNPLRILESDPRFRAQRRLDRVFARLDPRLLLRGSRMVEAAREVMRHEGRSGWGWVTYYSRAHTFLSMPVPTGVRIWTPRPGGGEDPPAPPPTPRGGGSGPGGPATGG